MNLKNKKILVTGGKGFLGSFLVPKIKEKGANVFVFGRKNYDLTKETEVTKLLNDSKPEVVIHLAVDGGGIGYIKDNPGSVFYNNVIMNTMLQEQCMKKGIEKFVGIGTVCSYPKFTPVPFKEENLWKGYPEETNAPYGLAKKMMLIQSQAYRKQYKFNAIHLLQANLYGPKDNFDLNKGHVIAGLIRKIKEAKENNNSLEVWGTGKASREFFYAKDAAEAIILATKYYDKPEPINLGSGEEITIKELVNKLTGLMDFRGEIKWDSTKPDGQPRRCLDVLKAEQEFGFKAQTSFDKGLKKTIEWYVQTKNL